MASESTPIGSPGAVRTRRCRIPWPSIMCTASSKVVPFVAHTGVLVTTWSTGAPAPRPEASRAGQIVVGDQPRGTHSDEDTRDSGIFHRRGNVPKRRIPGDSNGRIELGSSDHHVQGIHLILLAGSWHTHVFTSGKHAGHHTRRDRARSHH